MGRQSGITMLVRLDNHRSVATAELDDSGAHTRPGLISGGYIPTAALPSVAKVLAASLRDQAGVAQTLLNAATNIVVAVLHEARLVFISTREGKVVAGK